LNLIEKNGTGGSFTAARPPVVPARPARSPVQADRLFAGLYYRFCRAPLATTAG